MAKDGNNGDYVFVSELYLYGCTLLRYGSFLYPEAENYDTVDVEPTEDRPFNWDLVLTCQDGFLVMEEDVSAAEAKHAMQWVADNFYRLWD